jgi:hypothetical protein
MHASSQYLYNPALVNYLQAPEVLHYMFGKSDPAVRVTHGVEPVSEKLHTCWNFWRNLFWFIKSSQIKIFHIYVDPLQEALTTIGQAPAMLLQKGMFTP